MEEIMTNSKMRLALSVTPEALTHESLSSLAAEGIYEIELSSGNFERFERINFVNRSVEIAEMTKKYGITISSIHLPFLPFGIIDPSNSDPAHRMTTVEKQSELICAAGKAGIKLAIIHPSGEPYPEIERADRMNRALAMLAALSGIAYAAGVTLCIENLPRTCLGRDSGEMRYFLDRIPTLRACFDTNHSLGEDNVHFICALGDKIVTLHVSDYDFIDERHLLPCEGKNDWEAMITALNDVGYSGRFLYELRQGYTYAQIAKNYRSLMEKFNK